MICETHKNWKGRAMKQKYDTYLFSAKEYMMLTLEVLGISLLFNYLFFRSMWGLLLIFPVGWLCFSKEKKRKLEKLRQTLHYHFKEAVSAIHTSVLSGHSLENSVKEAYLELEKAYGKSDVMVQELHMMCNQISLKIPVEELFADLGSRSKIDDIITFAHVIRIAKRTGGNLNQILQATWNTLSEKIETRQEIDAQLAAKKFEQNIMSLMPACIILYLQLTMPSFLLEMYTTSVGRIVMTFSLILYAAAYLLGSKIVDIEV